MQKKYNKSFQGLRWLAAVMVFICHTDFLYNGAHQEILDGLGPFAVVIFFTLSGYLAQKNFAERQIITTDENNRETLFKSCCNSFIKAVKAYFPIHILTLIIAVALNYSIFIESPSKSIIKLILNLLLLHAWLPQTYASFNSISWYISIMLFIMAISPLVVRLAKKINWKISIILLIFINALQFLLAFLVKEPYGFYFVYIFPPVRLLNYFAGCLLFNIQSKFDAAIKSYISIIILCLSFILGGVLLYFYIGQTHFMYLSAIWSIPAWGIVFALACGNEKSKAIQVIFANRVAVFLGGVTFEFFMIHMLVLNIGRAGYNYFGWGDRMLIFIYIIAFAVSLICAIVLHYLRIHLNKKIKQKSKTHLNDN